MNLEIINNWYTLISPNIINKLELYFVVLFDSMPDNLGILCLHGGIIVNTNNSIIYNGGIHEFLTITSNMSLNKLLKMLCDWLD